MFKAQNFSIVIFTFVVLFSFGDVNGFKIILEDEGEAPGPAPPDVKSEEFLKWFQEQEAKAVERILEKISSPDDTSQQREAKVAVAQYLVNVTFTAVTRRLGNFGKSVDASIPATAELVAIPAETVVPEQTPSPNVTSPIEVNPSPQPTHVPQPLEQFIVLGNQNQNFTNTSGPIIVPVSSSSAMDNSSMNATTEEGSRPFWETLGIELPMLPEFPDHIFNVPTPTPKNDTVSMSQIFLGNQVEKLVDGINNQNLSGIVDSTINIATPSTVGVLVNALLNIVLCSPVDRWYGNCGLE